MYGLTNILLYTIHSFILFLGLLGGYLCIRCFGLSVILIIGRFTIEASLLLGLFDTKGSMQRHEDCRDLL